MRSASSTLFLAAALAAGCGQASPSERQEFDRLERSLSALSSSLEGSWLERLDDVRRMEIGSQRVAAVRTTCVAAYEKFGEATARLRTARDDVDRLEKSLRGKTDAGLDEISRLHTRAGQATEDVSSSLDDAEALVVKCEHERRGLREALATSR